MKFLGQVAIGLGTALLAVALVEFVKARDVKKRLSPEPVAPGATTV